jgi:hypothetical protein
MQIDAESLGFHYLGEGQSRIACGNDQFVIKICKSIHSPYSIYNKREVSLSRSYQRRLKNTIAISYLMMRTAFALLWIRKV